MGCRFVLREINQGSRYSGTLRPRVFVHALPRSHRHPEGVRTAITMLIKASNPSVLDLGRLADERRKSRDELAMRLAQECRYIIQGCLREEEWLDADYEFYEILNPHVCVT